MKKISVFLIFLLSIGSLLGQNNTYEKTFRVAKKNYTKGTKALEKGNFAEAIDLLTLSINDEAVSSAYFNRASAYIGLGDTCQFCDDMYAAAEMDDGTAYFVYQSYCTKKYVIKEVPDSYREDYPDIELLEVILHKCQTDSVINIILRENINDHDPILVDSTEIYTVVEKMPEFIGGQEAMMQFIATNIKYPVEARENLESGVVRLRFVIDVDGFTKNITVMKSVSPSIDQEAIRIVYAMPQWKPGKLNGKKVPVTYNLPIRFKFGQ